MVYLYHKERGSNMKLNRNDLCWCGSQQKYKKCHLQFDEKLEQLKQQGKIIPLHQMIKIMSKLKV